MPLWAAFKRANTYCNPWAFPKSPSSGVFTQSKCDDHHDMVWSVFEVLIGWGIGRHWCWHENRFDFAESNIVLVQKKVRETTEEEATPSRASCPGRKARDDIDWYLLLIPVDLQIEFHLIRWRSSRCNCCYNSISRRRSGGWVPWLTFIGLIGWLPDCWSSWRCGMSVLPCRVHFFTR